MKWDLLGSRELEIVRLFPCSAVAITNRPVRGAIGMMILLLLSAPAEGRWRLDVEGGAIVPTSNVTLGSDDGRDDARARTSGIVDFDTTVTSDFDVGGSFAVGGGYSLNDYVEVGGQFQSNFSGFDIGLASDTLQVYSLTAGPRLYLLPHEYRVRPWVVGQAGWYRARAEASLFGADVGSTEDAFGANLGGGFDVAIVPRVSLGLDVRYHRPVDVFDGFAFVTTMLNVGFHFGQQD